MISQCNYLLIYQVIWCIILDINQINLAKGGGCMSPYDVLQKHYFRKNAIYVAIGIVATAALGALLMKQRKEG